MRSPHTAARKASIAVLAAAALLLAACSSGQASKDSSGSSGKVVKVTAILELTGATAEYGNQAKAGIETFLAEQKKKNPAVKLDVSYADCGQSLSACTQAARTAVNNGADVVMGPVTSTALSPVFQVTQASKIPHIWYTVSSGYDGATSYRFGDPQAANFEAASQLVLKKLKPGDPVAILYVNNQYGQDALAAVSKTLTSGGLNVAAKIEMQSGANDYTPQVLQARAVNPKAVFIYTQPPADVAAVLRAAQDNNLKSMFIQDANPGVIQAAGSAANGLIQVGPWFPVGGNSTEDTFMSDAVGTGLIKTPSWVAAMAYDGAKALSQVTQSMTDITPGNVAKALDGLSKFNGIGVTDGGFSKVPHDLITKPNIAQVQDGKYVAYTQ